MPYATLQIFAPSREISREEVKARKDTREG